ncbi:MAG: hypothetical protein KF799_00795 [Bdellovibrionales bacterium]|nr:hypothetical protein [Bdellovibrionales bacterium]
MKWIKYILGGILAFLVALLLLVLVVNGFDKKLKPEVKAALEKPLVATETEKRAYFFLLGLYGGAPATEAEKKGEALWTRKDEPGFWDPLRKNDIFKMGSTGCPHAMCNAQALKDDPSLLEKLKAELPRVQDYMRLISYGEGITLFRGDEHTIFPPISALPYSPHQWFLLQLSEWSLKGGQLRVIDLLIASNHYLVSFVKNGTLIERAIGVAGLRANAAFVKSEIERNPRFPANVDLMKSFNFPRSEDIIFGAVEVELKIVANMVHSIESLSDSGGIENGLPALVPARLMFRPNDTLNHYFDISTQAASADCPNADLVACVPAAKWMRLKYPWQWISNPVGRAMVGITVVHIIRQQQIIERRRAEIMAVQDLMREQN